MLRGSRIAGIAVAAVIALGSGPAARQDPAQADAKIAALITAVQREPWPRQAAAIESLGATGDPRATEPLAALLESRAWYVRDAAIRAIGRLKGDAAIRVLVTALGDGHGLVRQSAREALVARGEAAVPAVVPALDSSDERVRWQAAWVLRHGTAPGITAPLLHAIERGEPSVRVEAAIGLARAGSNAPLAELISLLTSRDPAVRQEAAWVLGRAGSQRAVGPLIALLADSDAGWMAAMALGELGAPSAAAPVAAALRNSSVRTRRAVAWALGNLGTAGTILALRKALGDPDEEVRYWAARALRRIGTAEAARAAAAAQPTRWDRDARRCAPARSGATISAGALTVSRRSYPLYPETLETEPQILSPLTATDGTELMIAVTSAGRYAIVPVTLKESDRQCDADAADFPTLARWGVHADSELDRTHTITGRSIVEIAELGRAGFLSDDGFLEPDEDIVSILRDDNDVVKALGLTHPELAQPLFYIWNMMNVDLDLNRWNMAEHRWGNVTAVLSHGRRVRVVAGDTKGGQRSIFDDAIEGSFWIEITGDLTAQERAFLKKHYGHLEPQKLDAFIRSLTHVKTGEIQPHYITWYGFYEGRTPWRTDPIALAFIFGLRTLEEIEAAVPGRLYEVMMARYVEVGS